MLEKGISRRLTEECDGSEDLSFLMFREVLTMMML